MKKHKRLSNVDSVKEITVIEVTSIRGSGTSTDAHNFWLAQAPHWY